MVRIVPARTIRSCSRFVSQRPRCFSTEKQVKPPPSWRDPGTLSIRLGWSIIALLVIDQGLQYQQKLAREKFFNSMSEEHEAQSTADVTEWRNAEALYSSVVRRVPEMDGYKSLKGVEKGNVVQVLEEKAGPDQMYCLCRIQHNDGTVSVGWFPTANLEKQEEPVEEIKKPIKRWFKFW